MRPGQEGSTPGHNNPSYFSRPNAERFASDQGFTLPRTTPWSERLQDFVKLPNGLEVYIDWTNPTYPGEVSVLVNGMTYTTETWAEHLLPYLEAVPSTLRFDMRRQGRTLLNNETQNRTGDQGYRTLVNDLDLLLKTLGIEKRCNLIGLSQGAAIGFAYLSEHPEYSGSLTMMSPVLVPLHKQDRIVFRALAQDWGVKASEIDLTDPRLDDAYLKYLRGFVEQAYSKVDYLLGHPDRVEHMAHLCRGLYFLVRDIATGKITIPARKDSLHLVIAQKDEHLRPQDLLKFASERLRGPLASCCFVRNARHDLPEQKPELINAWLARIASQDQALRNGSRLAL